MSGRFRASACSLNALLKPPFRLIVYGESGSGKTSAVRKIAYELGHLFDFIIVNSYNAAENPNYDFTPRRISGEASEALAKIIDFNLDRVRSGQRPVRVLLIIEDYSGLYPAKSRSMTRLSVEGRQYGISTIIVAHRLSLLPTIVRDNSSHFLLVGRPKLDQLKVLANGTHFTIGELRELTDSLALPRTLLLPVREKAAYSLLVDRLYATVDL